MKKHLKYIFLVVLVLGTAWIAVAQKTAPYRKCQGEIFGTYYSVTYQSPENLDSEILRELEAVDKSMSMFNPESTISKINSGKTSEVDDLLLFLLPRALKVSEATGGAFDVTVAPLCNAWGFGWKKGQWPTDQQIDSIRQFVGYKHLHLNDRTLTKDDPRTMVDLSAIAKGYGVDRVAEMLSKNKVENYMIFIGGEDRMHGVNEKGETWRIGIEKPELENSETQTALRDEPKANKLRNSETKGYQEVLQITDQAVATSGNYRNFFMRDGKKYAHTIDPRTGRPVQHDVISATIMAPECWEADAYATSCMVMGLDSAKKVILANKNLKAYLIYLDKNGKQQVWRKD